MPHALYIPFLFALGACVGSFLNVVIWRLPRGESLSYPPSHCPKCNNTLKWYDNVPVFGWLKLGGKCRFCKNEISPRYPIVEAVTGLLFVFYYVAFFIVGIGPCATLPLTFIDAEGMAHTTTTALSFREHWPVYGLYMFLITGLLAASLIDAELFIIPLQIPWAIVPIAILTHAIIDTPATPGNLILSPPVAAMALGGAIGLLISFGMSYMGWLRPSFHLGEPLLESEREEAAEEQLPRPPSAFDRAMAKAIKFVLPPLALAVLAWLFVAHSPAA